MHPAASARAAAGIVLALVFAGCGGRGVQNALPSMTHQSAASPRARMPLAQPPMSGVHSAALAEFARARILNESKRRSGRPLEKYGPAGIGTARVLQSVSESTTGSATALVLYDTAGQWGFLGELYAMGTANLAGHFGAVTAEPVTAYTTGQLIEYTATIYIGSTYYDSGNDLVPAAFYRDVVSSSKPVLWVGDNIWNMATAVGQQAFENRYGWDPTNSYTSPGGSVGSVTQVDYKNQALTRTVPTADDGGIVHPYLMGSGYPAVTTLATAVDSSTSPATTFPWAIRSRNLTYIGEIPFDYVNESDRIVAFEDLLFDALAPGTPSRHRAMVRLEDISAQDDPKAVLAAAQYLYSQHVPYGFNIIPRYVDPTGSYNAGVPQDISLTQAPALVSAIKYMLGHGGTMVAEGYTHQLPGNNANPYDGVSGDDAEFYLAHVDANNYVLWDGPVPGDSSGWAAGRVSDSLTAFRAAGLPAPKLWVTPHYFATDVDYRAIATLVPARYERSVYYNGDLAGGPVNYQSSIGVFYPYVVHDIYGTKVIPENIGDYEPTVSNHNAVRLPADLIHNARLNLAVRDGFASFFFDPSYPVEPLQETISGIKALGYTFVSPSSL